MNLSSFNLLYNETDETVVDKDNITLFDVLIETVIVDINLVLCSHALFCCEDDGCSCFQSNLLVILKLACTDFRSLCIKKSCYLASAVFSCFLKKCKSFKVLLMAAV